MIKLGKGPNWEAPEGAGKGLEPIEPRKAAPGTNGESNTYSNSGQDKHHITVVVKNAMKNCYFWVYLYFFENGINLQLELGNGVCN